MTLANVRRVSLSLSGRFGLSRLVGRTAWRRERLLILCYHGVSLHDEHRWNPELYVSQRTFARRLELIRKHRCTVLPLGEAAERLARRDLPERSVALTFDDGYFDFLARAHPLLKAFACPATVYLTTMRCEHNAPIARLLISYVLWRCRDERLDGRGIQGLGGQSYSLRTPAERAAVVRRLDDEILRARMTRPQKDALAREVAARLGVDADALARTRMLTLMNPAEVRRVAHDGSVRTDVELHTHSHRTPEDPGLFRKEITENRARIETMTGRRPVHFCYPSGVYRLSYLPVLRSEGVVTATTCESGLASSRANLLLMPRFVDTMRVGDSEFEGWLTGAASWLARTPRAACL
jgi:peptidoglycan/xylan/chitin deacetylase (PgdA/CDA1 family)